MKNNNSRGRGRPGWWAETLSSMECGQTLPVQNKSEAMTVYIAARRMSAGFKICVEKQDDGTYICEKVCL